jgi:hypothetical protein
MPYSASQIKGLQSSARRGLAFLESDTNQEVNAKRFFETLKEKKKLDVLARFDYWIAGGHCDLYFHGWPNDEQRKHCFVFKWKAAGSYYRLYGFLLHPRPLTNPAFQTCTLVSHATKNNANTDPAEINAVNTLRLLPAVVAAVRRAFPEGN